MAARNLTILLCLSAILAMASGCQPVTEDDDLSGRITLWHSWTAEEATQLRIALQQFQEIHPNVRVAELALPEDQILSEFQSAARNGLAPGILIGHSGWIRELADDDLLRPFPATEAPATLSNPRIRALVQYKDQILGLPLFMEPRALYYNESLVLQPSRTLDDLLHDAGDGNRVEFVPRFEEAYWGIQAFGDGLFDTDGRFTLAHSGFEEWLGWLDRAQRDQNVILNVDSESLRELFTSGKVAYYVAGPDSLKSIMDGMDPDNPFSVGVAPLPAGAAGPAGPLAEAETMMFYSHASPEQALIANALAVFLLNERQAIQFMRELDKVPADPRIVVDRRVYPLVSGFAQQARTAVALPHDIPRDQLTAAGNRAYTSVLSGALTPAESVCQFGLEVVTFMSYASDQFELPEGCNIELDE